MTTNTTPSLPVYVGKPLQDPSGFPSWRRRIQLHLELLQLWDKLTGSSVPLSAFEIKKLHFYLESSLDESISDTLDWSKWPKEVFESICREFGVVEISRVGKASITVDRRENGSEKTLVAISSDPVDQSDSDLESTHPGPSTSTKKKKKNKKKKNQQSTESPKEVIDTEFDKRDWFLSTRHQDHFCVNPDYFESMTPLETEIPSLFLNPEIDTRR